MFNFSNLKQIHLEITNNCQASCPMCNRNINGGIDNPLIKIKNWTIDDFKKVITLEVLQQLSSYYFCGNFGDPILNNDLIKMCEYSNNHSPNTGIVIHTNGSARSVDWWKTLANVLPKNHRVVFALDGLFDTHQLYRIGTKFETVLENAKTFIEAGGIAEWVFIKFKHNEHQVDEARLLSQQLGFKYFTLKNSSRFILEPKINVMNKQKKITHFIEPASDVPLKFIDKKIIDNYQQIVDKSIISCKSKNDKEVYIDAYGDLFPCCWLASVPYSYINPDEALAVRQKMREQHDELVKKLGSVNTFERSIKEIIESHAYQTVWDDFWSINKLVTCARTCGTNTDFIKPRDQIVQ